MTARLLELLAGNLLLAFAIAGVACLASRRKLAPRWVHGLWLLVLVKLVTPPLFELPLLPPLPSDAPAQRRAGTVGDDLEHTTLLGVDPAPEPEPDLERPGYEARAVELPTPLFSSAPATPRGGTVESGPRPGARPERSAPRASAPAYELLVPPAAAIDAESRTGLPAPRENGRATPMRTWPAWLAAAWLLGAIAVWGSARRQVVALANALRLSEGVSSAKRRALQAEVDDLARCVGLERPPRVCLVPLPWTPSVCRIAGRTRLVMSTGLLARLSDEERRTLLVHELAHLKRRDPIVRYLELFVRGVHWWNPLVPWTCRRLRAAEEECCDAWVLATLPRSGRAYASALLTTAEFLSSAASTTNLPATASGLGRVENLQRRLNMILQPRARETSSLAPRLALGALALGVLPILPSFAQSRASEPEAEPAPEPVPAIQARVAETEPVLELIQAQIAETEPAAEPDPEVIAQVSALEPVQVARGRSNTAVADLEDTLAARAAVEADLLANIQSLARAQSGLKKSHSRHNALEAELAALRAQLADLHTEKQALQDELAARLAARDREYDSAARGWRDDHNAQVARTAYARAAEADPATAQQYREWLYAARPTQSAPTSQASSGPARGTGPSAGGSGASFHNNPTGKATEALQLGSAALRERGDLEAARVLDILADEFAAKGATLPPGRYVGTGGGIYARVQPAQDASEERLRKLERKVDQLIEQLSALTAAGGGGAR